MNSSHTISFTIKHMYIDFLSKENHSCIILNFKYLLLAFVIIRSTQVLTDFPDEVTFRLIPLIRD